MGVFDWLKQTVSNVGSFVKDKVLPGITKGADWLNQNVVQPGASIARNIPGVGGAIADLASKAGNLVNDGLQSQWGDKRKFDVGKAFNTGRDLYSQGKDIYNQTKRIKTM